MDGMAMAGLAGLALVDSTSFGTLGIPVVMLAQRDVRARPFLVYLATISVFYLALGVLLLGGVDVLAGPVSRALQSPAALWVQGVLGVALLVGSFFVDGGAVRRRAARRAARGLPPRAPRRERWVAAMVGPRADGRAAAGVALAAGLVEAASMLPYLAAVGILSSAGWSAPARTALLGAYVLVMALPALLLLAARLAFAERLRPALARIDGWLRRWSADAVSWVVGIVGFLLARDALSRLIEHGALPWWPSG